MTEATLTVTIGGVERELFMSYGLLTKLSKELETADAVGAVPHDPEMRDNVLKIALTERTRSGKAIKEIKDLDDVEISLEDVEAVLGWVMEHLTGFFVRGLQKTKKVLDDQKELTDLFSQTGSEA